MKKVLVVDFDVEFLKSVSLMLREEGFEIITAVDGQAGLERFEADKPDLVVLEAMLPRLHGFELCARITENQTHPAPVIVITGVYRDALYKTEALRTFGATAYFEKPVDMTRLLEAIHKALNTPASGAQAPEPKKAPAAGEKPPLRPAARPAAQAPAAAVAAAQVKPQPVLRPQPPPRVQAAPALTPVAAPPVIPAKKKDADQIEIDSLLKSALAELGLEPEEPKTPPKPVVASPPSIQPPPRPVAPPPPPRPIQPPPRPAAAPFIPPSAKPVAPVPPPQPKPVAPAAPPVQPKPMTPVPPPKPPVPPVAKPVPPPQPKPIAPAPPSPPAPPIAKPVPPPQPKPIAPAPPVPEPPPPAAPIQRPKPAIVAPPPPIPVPRPTPPPALAPVHEVHPAPPPLRQPTPEKLPVFEKSIETHVHAPAVPAMEMPERRAHAPAFPEFMAEPKKKSSPVIFIAAAAVLGIAALGYFLVLKPKGPETTPTVSQGQPPPVVSERASVENAPRFESQPAAKAAVKTPTGTAKPKPTPPPAIKPEPEATTPATQPVIPAGEPKLEIQVPEQTAPQATAKPATEQTTTPAQSTLASPPPDAAPAAPAKAQTGQLVSLDDVETPPRVVTRVDPAYPPIAYRMGIQGTVWINALISETGNVLQAIFLRGTTAGGLDKAAETAVLKWKYQPAQKDGVNVKVWLPVRVDFVKRS